MCIHTRKHMYTYNSPKHFWAVGGMDDVKSYENRGDPLSDGHGVQ